jgi:putative ABC transport system permease protein
MDTFLQDLRFAARVLLKSPGFAAVAILTLGLGIGGSTAIFSAVDAVLLRPLPFAEPARLVAIWTSEPKRGARKGSNSFPDFEDYRKETDSFEDLAAFRNMGYTLVQDGRAERIEGGRVSASFFPILRVSVALGRTFTTEEDRPGAARTALLAHGLWQRRFGGSPDVLGQSLLLDGQPYTVIGVLPASFHFPMDLEDAELYTTMGLEDEESRQGRGMHYLRTIGRLKAGASVESAGADLAALSARLETSYPDSNQGRLAVARPLHEEIVGDVRVALFFLLGAVGLVLLLACANVANLLLARASARERELAIRGATGASRARLLRQLLTESVLLAVVGGALGVFLAFWGVDVFLALAPADLPRLAEVGVDSRVLLFATLVSLATGLVFGTVPAWRAARVDLVRGLAEGGSAGSSPAGRRLRSALVVAEVALSLVLLVGAGLLLRSLFAVLTVDPGFEKDGVVSLAISLPETQYDTGEKRAAFYRTLLERTGGLPGVTAVGAGMPLPMSGSQWVTTVRPEGRPEPPPSQRLHGDYKAVSPGYFSALGIRLIRGRLFAERDARDAPRVILISDAFARRYYADEDPLGKRLRFGVSIDDDDEDALWEIVGVVGDVAHLGLDREPRPSFYVPAWQHPWSFLSLVVRTPTSPAALSAAVRQEVRALDSDLPVYRVRTLAEMVSATVAQRRFNALLIAAFAAIGLVLASVGIYGVLSISVTQKTREIGIRMALGADRGLVLKMIVGQALALAGTGVALGLLVALVVGQTVTTLLFRISATDPPTYSLVPAVLLLAALLASLIPARRALAVAPYIALRHE